MTLKEASRTLLIITLLSQLCFYSCKTKDNKLTIPTEPGQYVLEASIEYKGENIKSFREFIVE